jgi:hypothetical protein
MAWSTLIGTLASISQQLHSIIRWTDIKVEQYNHTLANIGKPELAVAGQSVGADLVLFFIRKPEIFLDV